MTENLIYVIPQFYGTHRQLFIDGTMFVEVTDLHIYILGYASPLDGPSVQMALNNCLYDPITEGEYPELLNEDCVAGVVTVGNRAYVDDIELIVYRPLPIENSTWGRIKALYR